MAAIASAFPPPTVCSIRLPIRTAHSGRIDEFSVYRRALDESEVVRLFTVDPAPDDR